MDQRKLGNSNLQVPPLCFGGNVFGWTADQPTSFRLLDACLSAGLNFIDTADVYSRWAAGNHGGESETIIGRWMKSTGKRKHVIIATKVGMDMGDGKNGLSKKRIRQAVEESLQRLQTDYIDLYRAHRDDPNIPLEETLETFTELVREGKARVIGASNYDANRLAEALRVSRERGLVRYESLQPNYNLYDRADYEQNLEPLCLKEHLGVISYFSLAKGFLSGKYRSKEDLSKSPRGTGVQPYLNDRGNRILKALDEVAQEHNASPASVSIGWLIARPSITAPIASATNERQLSDLVKATELKLDEDAIRKLTEASA